MDWWERLVGGEEPLSLGLHRGVTSPERSLRWVKDQVAKTLFLAHKYGFFDEVVEAIKERKHKVRKAEKEKWKHFASLKKAAKTSGGAHAYSDK